VEVIIHKAEYYILRINFYSGTETLVQVGYPYDFVKEVGGRMETFEIAADEQLIGAELYHGPDGYGDFFQGLTWLKCKIRNEDEY
jgi:hypothetical protein